MGFFVVYHAEVDILDQDLDARSWSFYGVSSISGVTSAQLKTSNLTFCLLPHIIEVGKEKNTRKVGAHMDLARVSSKGQVTIPIEIRRALGIKEGDKVVFTKKDGEIVLLNANRLAFEQLQNRMAGAAAEAGITSEQDVVDIVREVRRQMWEERNEGHV